MSEYIAEYDEFVDADGHAYCLLCSGRKEEITRCRDCKYYYAHGVPTCQRNKEWFTGYDIDGNYGEWCDGEFYVEPDGFCAWAVRRDA